MSTAAKIYIAVVGALAAAVIGSLDFDPITAVSPGLAASLAAFVVVGCVAEGMAVDFRLGPGRQAKSSLAFLPFLSSIAIFSPILAVLAVGSVVFISQTVIRRTDFYRSAFNIAQAVLAAGAASLMYGYISRDVRPDTISFVGFISGAAVFFSVNIILNTIAIALVRGESAVRVFKQVGGTRGSNLWYDLLASPIALVPAVLYSDYNVLGLFLIVLPLLLIRYTYSSIVKLEDTTRDLMRVLVKAIETRDPYTSGHSVRVSTLAKLVAEDMRLAHRIIRDVEIAALLHDIGKIDPLYAEMIRKPYDLNRIEREVIRTHATKGADLLESLTSVSKQIIDAVRHHHEKFDGTGYPIGLAAGDIPIAARIIMLCDSVDAMLSDRPYRKALSIEQTRSELVRCSGSQFDPAIVETVLRNNTLEKAVLLITGFDTASASEPASQQAMAVAVGQN